MNKKMEHVETQCIASLLKMLEGKRQFANLSFDMSFKKAFGSEGEEMPLKAMLN